MSVHIVCCSLFKILYSFKKYSKLVPLVGHNGPSCPHLFLHTVNQKDVDDRIVFTSYKGLVRDKGLENSRRLGIFGFYKQLYVLPKGKVSQPATRRYGCKAINFRLISKHRTFINNLVANVKLLLRASRAKRQSEFRS